MRSLPSARPSVRQRAEKKARRTRAIAKQKRKDGGSKLTPISRSGMRRQWCSLIRKRAKRATIASQEPRRSAARPNPSRRKERLLRMTIKVHHYQCQETTRKTVALRSEYSGSVKRMLILPDRLSMPRRDRHAHATRGMAFADNSQISRARAVKLAPG